MTFSPFDFDVTYRVYSSAYYCLAGRNKRTKRKKEREGESEQDLIDVNSLERRRRGY